MFRNGLPKLRILVDTDLFACIELVVAVQFNWLREKRYNVWIERLPVWVLEMVSGKCQSRTIGSPIHEIFWLTSGCPRWQIVRRS